MKEDKTHDKKNHLQIMLEDPSNNKLQCVLWEPYCTQLEQFVEAVRAKSIRDPVLIIQLCRTKIFMGEVGISNTFHATKVISDQSLDEIMDFKTKLPSVDDERNYDGSQLSNSSVVSVEDELINPTTNIITIEDLLLLNMPCKAWFVASISEVMFQKGWYYTSCKGCHKKVTEQDGKFYCNDCRGHVVGDSNFKVIVKVVDGTANTKLLMWDRTVRDLLKKSASKVLQGCIKGCYGKDSEVLNKDDGKLGNPAPVDGLCGMELMFRVAVEEKNLIKADSIYTVDKYSANPNLIMKYKKTDHTMGSLSVESDHDLVGDMEDNMNNATFKSPNEVLGKRGFGDTMLDSVSLDGETSTNSKRRVLLTPDEIKKEK